MTETQPENDDREKRGRERSKGAYGAKGSSSWRRVLTGSTDTFTLDPSFGGSEKRIGRMRSRESERKDEN